MGSSNGTACNRKRLAYFRGTASILTILTAMSAEAQHVAQAQAAKAQTAQISEEVVVTGSLIGGAVIGAPVTSFGAEDFADTGSLTVSDLLGTDPSIFITTLGDAATVGSPGAVEVHQSIAIHGIQRKSLLLFDGQTFFNSFGTNTALDPSIIPSLAVDRVDVLADGASATYGSNAVTGVVNVVLKRGFDGAITRFQVSRSTNANYDNFQLSGAQLFGRTWDGGDITATYEFDQYHNVHGAGIARDTFDYTSEGLDNETPLIASVPGIVSVGTPKAVAGAPSGFSATTGATCGNCYSIPKGQNGVGLTWATVLTHQGESNEINPYDYQDFIPWTQRNSFVVTFDQKILPGVELTAEAFYSNQRNIFNENGVYNSQYMNAYSVVIPTSNPNYPIGAPAGLVMAYDFNAIDQSRATTGSWDGRWEVGLNFDLPFSWNGRAFFQTSKDYGFDSVNMVNPNLVTAAVGGTVPAVGNFAAYTKPATVPYLNLFCDPTAFSCIDPATLAYIDSNLFRQAHQNLNEAKVTFDGTLFELPGGPLKAALGMDYQAVHWNYFLSHGDSSDLGNAAPIVSQEARYYSVVAGYGQLNVPVFGEANAIPLIKKLDLELSGRIDSYSTVGMTENPKISFTWDTGLGLSLNGAWGTSFRAPSFIELSGLAASSLTPLNIAGGATKNSVTVTCTNGTINPGSAAAQLGAACGASPGGIALNGGFGLQTLIHPGAVLEPEHGTNWELGFDFHPTDYLKGLDVGATFWNLKITNVVNTTNLLGGLNDPQAMAAGDFITNKDPNFAAIMARILANPVTSPSIIPSAVTFIEDQADTNVGYQAWQGIDFHASYDLDLGDLGAWNTGITGVYYLSQSSYNGPGTSVANIVAGSPTGLHYRVHLGWVGGDDDAYSATLFMNHTPHVTPQPGGSTYPACFLIGNPACNASGLPQFAQYSQQYPTITPFEPALDTFDLSFGYKTGDRPANDYLKHLSFQLTIDNIMNKLPRFAFATKGGFEINDNPSGREVTFSIIKAW